MTRALEEGQLRLSLVVLCELRFGAENALLARERRPADRVAQPQQAVPLEIPSEEVALRYGRLRANLEASGRLIGAMDMLLAAHAPALETVVVTGNVREFARVPGLGVEDWRGGVA